MIIANAAVSLGSLDDVWYFVAYAFVALAVLAASIYWIGRLCRWAQYQLVGQHVENARTTVRRIGEVLQAVGVELSPQWRLVDKDCIILQRPIQQWAREIDVLSENDRSYLVVVANLAAILPNLTFELHRAKTGLTFFGRSREAAIRLQSICETAGYACLAVETFAPAHTKGTLAAMATSD
jgi:hypothetical protein